MMKTNSGLLTLFLLLIIMSGTRGQMFKKGDPFTHTYSIVARDPQTGEMGVAVQSHWFSVGTVVAWGEAGVGIVATQSLVNVSFGVRGLELLKKGLSPQQVVDTLLSADEGRDFRQLAVLDSKGRVSAYTGKNCMPEAGHIIGDGFSVQANLMLSDKVWPDMDKAFKSSKGPLAERMIAALEAAQAAGGDIRGKQSAALLVVKGEPSGKVWEDRLVDLRIDDHAEPLKELRRILNVHNAYQRMNNGDLALEKGDVDGALREYSAAEAMFPDNLEMKYWHAVSLVNAGRLEEALPMFNYIFAKDNNWKILTPKLVKPGILTVDEEGLKRILMDN